MKDSQTRRRKERAQVKTRLQGVYLKCPELSAQDLRVDNVSELGVGVETTPILTVPDAGKILAAKLVVGRTVAPVQVRLVHMAAEVTGLEFVQPSSLLQGAIRQYFEPELVGASLRPVTTAEPRLVYETADGHRLELTVDKGKLSSFSVQVLGNLIQWDGKTLQLHQNSRKEPLPDFLRQQLVKLAQSADSIDSSLRTQLERILSGVA